MNLDIILEMVNENVKYKNLNFEQGTIEIYINDERFDCDIYEDNIYEEWVFEFNDNTYPLKYLISNYDEEYFSYYDYT